MGDSLTNAWVTEQLPENDTDYNMHVLKYVACSLIVKLAQVFLTGGVSTTQPGSDMQKLIRKGMKKMAEHKTGA